MSDVGNVHSGEVEGELEGVLRTLIASAGRLGESIARAREEAARRAEAESTQRARELQVQYEQERAMARAQVQPVNEPAWWDRASAEDIAHAYETTAAWKDDDPSLAEAHAKMGDELRERYGLDVNDLGADPQRVADVLRDREAAGEVVDAQKASPDVRAAADALLSAADRQDQAAGAVEHEGNAGQQDHDAGLSVWDNSDRRDAHAEQMAAQGVDPIAIQAQYGADVSNAQHPRAAITSTRGAAKARKSATRVLSTQRERGERSR
jgi:hypothetical protein